INEVWRKEGKRHNNAANALERRITNPEAQTTTSPYKKAESWEHEHLIGGHTDELPMQKRVLLVNHRYRIAYLKHWGSKRRLISGPSTQF
ncbi:hypothetical protein HAX54_041720, partial [Datura stramonium]|nr:hypothetical protein [Datura stramonium]